MDPGGRSILFEAQAEPPVDFAPPWLAEAFWRIAHLEGAQQHSQEEDWAGGIFRPLAVMDRRAGRVNPPARDLKCQQLPMQLQPGDCRRWLPGAE